MQGAASPDNSFIVLLELFVPSVECLSQITMMKLSAEILCTAGVNFKANTKSKQHNFVIHILDIRMSIP